jgi:hypothetical protein
VRAQQFWNEQAAWSQATFGSDTVKGPIGALKHLEKEAREAQNDPTDFVEYADCLFLTFDAARRAGLTLDSLLDYAFAKLEKNKKRVWPAPTMSDEPVEHVRGIHD